MPVVSSYNTKHKASQPPPWINVIRVTMRVYMYMVMMGTEQRMKREHVCLRKISKNRQTYEIFFDECRLNSYDYLDVSSLGWRFRKIFVKKCKIFVKNDLTTKHAYLSSVTV